MSNLTAPKDLQTALRAFVDQHGTAEAARRLSVSRESITRILANLEVRAATITHVREKLRGKH